METREKLDADVLIVGAGPAGLACALHLARLIRAHNEAGGKPELSAENIYVLEKGREIGAHQLSGAVMDPRGLAELVPDYAQTAPLKTPVTSDAAYFLTARNSWKLPITPPPLRNHGNYVISLNKFVKWLGGLVEQAGVNIFTQFAGAQLIYEGEGIAGVITDDKGRDKDGRPRTISLPATTAPKVTVLAEGPRGSLTKDLVARKKLDGLNPQAYSIGVKELWDGRPTASRPDWVAHTLGWPLDSSMYGGAGFTACTKIAFRWPRRRTRISRSALRSPRSVSEIQDPSLRAAHSRWRQARALRREDRTHRRLVLDAANLRRWRPDYRRFRRLS